MRTWDTKIDPSLDVCSGWNLSSTSYQLVSYLNVIHKRVFPHLNTTAMAHIIPLQCTCFSNIFSSVGNTINKTSTTSVLKECQRVLTSLRLLSSSFRHDRVVHCCVRFTGSNKEIKLSLLAVSATWYSNVVSFVISAPSYPFLCLSCPPGSLCGKKSSYVTGYKISVRQIHRN